MRIRLIVGWILVLSLVAAIGYAQEPPARRLGLAEALDLARRNNPAYLQASNDRWSASRQVSNANLSLISPTVDVGGTWYTSASGDRNFFGQSIRVPGLTQVSGSISLGYALSGATFANRGLSHAALNATDQDVSGALTLLETGVRQQYLEVLKAKAQEELARRSLERSRENLNLAQARNSVGQGTLIDVRRAEVERGQAEVALLRAGQTVENQTLTLFQLLGVAAPAPVRIELTDSFPVVEPRWSADDLLRQALAENPGLRALRAREASATWSVRSANSQYLPSLRMSADYGKYRTRQDTVTTTGTSPWNLSIGVSVPIYDRFQRNVETARARAQQDDVRLAIRSRELGVRSEVTAAFSTLGLAWRTIAIQDANRTASTEALELATQRYRVGSGTYIELLDARVSAERAAADYVTAVYDYHRAIAALEYAVGRPLR